MTQPTTLRRYLRRILVITLVTLLVAGGFWTAWGLSLDRRYEALVDELHGMGVPIWEELTLDLPADADNGWPLLVQAARLFDEVEKEHIDDREDHWDFLLSADRWSEEQRRFWRSLRPQIEPCLRLIEEAVRRPLLVPPPGGSPLHGEGGSVMSDIKDLLTNQVIVDPAAASRILPLYFDLASRWQPCGDRWVWRMILRWNAVTRMREGIASDSLDLAPIRERLEASLAAWDPVVEYGRQRLVGTMNFIWIVDEFRAGRDPTGRWREGLAMVRGAVSDDDENGPLGWLRLPPTGWAATWFGRPLMLREAIETLEACRALHSTELTLEEMRRSRDLGERQLELTKVAHVRLARLSLKVVAFRGEHGRLPTELADPRLGLEEELRTDPFTGEAFRFEARGEGVTVWSAFPSWKEPIEGGEARQDALRQQNLLWRIPAN